MVLTRSMMKRRARPSFYSLDVSSGSPNVFLRESRDSCGNTTREVIDLRKPGKRRFWPRSSSASQPGQRRSSGEALWRRDTLKSRGSSLWEESYQRGPQRRLKGGLQLAHQPTCMNWWLRTFRGLSGQVDSEVQQMAALELGLLEQFKNWDLADRTKLTQAIPELVDSMEKVHGQVESLVGWLRRLGDIIEQDIAIPEGSPELRVSMASGRSSSESKLSIPADSAPVQH